MNQSSNFAEHKWELADSLHVPAHTISTATAFQSAPVSANCLQYIDLRQADERAIQSLSCYGISAQTCRNVWQRSVNSTDNSDSPRHDLEDEIFRYFLVAKPAYVNDLFSRKGFAASDIFTERENLSTHSFLLDRYHIAYRFSSKEIYYIVTRAWRGRVAFIMVPRSRLVIGFPSADGDDPSKWNAALFHSFCNQVTTHYDAMASSLSKPTDAVCLSLGHTSNMGHFFWTDLAGVFDVLERYGTEKVRRIITGPHVYVAVEDVFPELINVPIVKNISTERLFEVGLRYNEQHVAPIGTRIKSDLRRRVSAACNAKVDADWLDNLRDAIDGKFVFWINLRAHNKMWIRQSEGFVHIVQQLRTAVKNDILAILDGWVDTRDIANRLAQELSPLCQVVDTLGRSFAESFVWAEHCHVFCTVIGSGLVINTWLTGKPGVAHANSPHMQQAEPWKYVADDMSDVGFVYPTKNFGDDLYSNYDVDEGVIADKLIQLVRKYYPDMLRSA